MEQHKIEVLLAAYNGAAYLEEQIDSILSQTYGNWILTISDDGSSDGTNGIIDRYVSEYPEKLRRLRSGKHFGSPKDHFMWLIGQSDADWIVLSDQDDVFFDWKFEKMAALMQKAEQTDGADKPILIFSDQTPTDARLYPLCDSLMKMQDQYTDAIDWRSLLLQNVVTGGACMFNRALAKLAGKCADISGIIMHDWWLGIVASCFGTVCYLNESTGYYRQHGSNAVGAKFVNRPSYIWERLRRMDEIKKHIAERKRQAAVFTRTYGETLSSEERKFILRFSKRRSGPFFYIRYHKLLRGSPHRLIGMILLG